ncbi:MAG: gliding motility-associated C-terminal domain-containing protein [Bacteroidia bacterium]|nr:gliding motility-associated C-terminal domain-containing protein [Bacteroidia bacterium]
MKKTVLVRVFCFLFLCAFSYTSYAQQAENCSNGIDDDGDGLVDCNDPDCSGFLVPASNYFHTGKNGNGGILPSGAPDMDWGVSLNGMGGPYNPAVVLGVPVTNPYSPSPWPDAQWISSNVNAIDDGQFFVGGLIVYYYRIQFNLPCSDACGNNIPASFCVNMSFMADNAVTNIFVNGVPQPAVPNMNPPGPGGFVGFQLPNAANINMCNNFQPGLNTILIEVTSGGGLAAFCAQTNVNAPPVPVNPTINPIIAGVNGVICDNHSGFTITADIGGGTWTASCGACIDSVTGDFDPAVSGTGTFNIRYSVQNGNICGSDTTSVTIQASPVVSAGPDITVCAQQPVTLTGSGANTYSWDNGVTNGIPFIATATQTYTLIGTAPNTCQDTDQVLVTVLPAPVANGGPDVQVCAGTQVTLSAIATPNPVWDNGVTDNVAFTPLVSQWYTLSATIGTCTDTDKVLVTVFPVPVADAGPDVQLCAGSPVTLAAIGSPNPIWDNGVTDNVAFTPAVTQLYTLISSLGPCQDTDQVTVTVLPVPVADAGADIQVCAGTQVTLTAIGSPNPGWDNGVTDNVAFTPAATQVYTLITTQGICQDTDQVTVTVIPIPPAPPLNGPSAVCEGDNLLLDMPTVPGLLYNWTLPGGNPQATEDLQIVPVQLADAGNYSLYVVFQGCTSAVSNYVLNVFPVKQSVLNHQMCQGETFVYQGQTYTQTGVYPVVLQAANGCDSTVTLTLNVTPMPVAGFNAPDRVQLDAPQMNVSDASANAAGIMYTLSNGAMFNTPDFSYLFLLEGQYELQQVVYNGNCVDSLSKFILVEPLPQIFIPNAFTPGKDDLNSEWKPVMSYLENYSLTIFSRWGEQVFRSSDVYKGWNGGWFNNTEKPVESGMYVYRIDYKEYKGKNKQLIGHLTLLR